MKQVPVHMLKKRAVGLEWFPTECGIRDTGRSDFQDQTTNKKHEVTCSACKTKMKGPQVEVGQYFQECDRRFIRVVRVLRVKGHRVQIKTVVNRHFIRVGSSGLRSATPVPVATGRKTWASKKRFYRRSDGYRRLYGKCHECQLAAGAEVPKGDLRGVTMTQGVCSGCLKVDASLVPSCDYNWPKEGRRAIFD